jgi:hypothetical protein
MVAPHGVCSDAMISDMVRLGFEAACISYGSLKAHDQDQEWTKRVGLPMSEMIAGLPVIPRFRISRNCQIDILLAAFLNQPVIPVGHHNDVAAGLELLEELADFINSLGEVRWLDMKSIAGSNYSVRQLGEALQVRMFSRSVRIRIPQKVRQLIVERPGLGAGLNETLVIRDTNAMSRHGKRAVAFDRVTLSGIPVEPGTEVEISTICSDAIPLNSISLPKVPPWAVIRRQLAECRDRISPLKSLLKKL